MADEEEVRHITDGDTAQAVEAVQSNGAGYDGVGPAEEPHEHGPDSHEHYLSAFLVVIDHNGDARATANINMPIVIERPASFGDMYRSCAEVMKDIERMETTQSVVNAMLQTSAQMAEMERNAKIAQKLQSKGIHLPGGARP